MSKEQAQATMRIDITPAMLEQLQQAPAPGGARIASRTPTANPNTTGVIRIPVAPAARPQSGEEFQALFQSIYDAVFITQLQGTIISANSRAAQFFTSTSAELCKLNILDVLCGADQTLLDTIAGSLEGNRFVLIQALCRRADETLFPGEISVSRLPMGGKMHLSFFVRDISVRKEQEERLKTGNTALQNSGSGIAVADVELTLAGYANPSMLTLLGLDTVEEAYVSRFQQFLKDPSLAGDMVFSVTAGSTWTGELEMVRKDGTTFFAQASLEPNLNPDGAMTGIVISLLDVTPQRLAQQELELTAAQLSQKNQEMEADLRLARDLQLAFLPSKYPTVVPSAPEQAGHLDFAHVYHPSGLVGGDFFNILPVSKNRVLIFMADVMGHGARAALVVATLRGLLEQFAKEAHDPGDFMTRLNTAYSRIFSTGGDLMFATACCVCFDLDTQKIQHANAGHPLPIVFEPDGTVRMAHVDEQALGPALGLFADAQFGVDEVQMRPGMRVLFYTDGLTEARNANQDEFEATAMMESLLAHRAAALPDMLNALVNDAKDFTGTPIFEDDVCLLAIGVSDQPPAPK